jgi:hypothetical protein
MASTNIKIITLIGDPSNKLTDNSYRVNLGNLGFDSFKICSLKSCSFRNLMYNVISTGNKSNNIFYFLLNGIAKQVVVSEGFYSIYELLAVLQTGIEGILASSGIIPLPTLTSLNYSTITGKVSILVDGNGAGTPMTLQGALKPYSINLLLGNSSDVDLDLLTPTEYEFEDIINLQACDSVNLVSSAVALNGGITNKTTLTNARNGRNLNLVRSIIVNAGFGGLVVYESNDVDAEALEYPLAQNFSQIDIALQDPDGNNLDLGNSTLKVELLTWKTI